jgi:molecular chaperone GrpE
MKKQLMKKLEELEEKITSLEEEIETEKTEKLRLLAEFENYKKRLEKEKNKSIIYANEKILFDFLEILDTLYISITMITNEKEKEGIKNTIEKYKNILKKHNVNEVNYDEFNPNLHNAIQKTTSEKEKDTILEIHQRGYTIGDKENERLLRSAMVTVSE